METVVDKQILEIQKLDRQIKMLEREVAKCPASVDFQNYKKFMSEGRTRLEQLEKQANDIIKNYNVAASKFTRLQGDSAIVRKQNTDTISLENVSNLIGEANSLVGELSEESRQMEELVRKAEEVVRKSQELSQKLTEAKMRSVSIKARIDAKQKEVEPKIADIRKKIAELEAGVKDKEKYEKYKTMKANGIFPVFVPLENEFCGGCKVELSLNFIEKLKNQKLLTCEHCGRVIMFEK